MNCGVDGGRSNQVRNRLTELVWTNVDCPWVVHHKELVDCYMVVEHKLEHAAEAHDSVSSLLLDNRQTQMELVKEWHNQPVEGRPNEGSRNMEDCL